MATGAAHGDMTDGTGHDVQSSEHQHTVMI